jgi:hypothetical protein
MRFFWSALLTGALFLVGFDTWEARRDARQAAQSQERLDAQTQAQQAPPAIAEDGTGYPPR